MSSFLRAVGQRKKSKRLGEAEILSQAEYAALQLDARVDLIRALIPLGLMHVEELLLEEVEASREAGTSASRIRLQACATGATRDRFDWAVNACRSTFRGFGRSAARSRFDRMRR